MRFAQPKPRLRGVCSMSRLRLCWASRIASLLLASTAVVAFNVFLYTQNASGHDQSSYAIITESSVGAYSGVLGMGDFENPDLGTGSFTNSTLWATKLNTCGSVSWVEVGWSKRAQWSGQARHKFMYLVSPGCVFTIWPNNLGAPAVGPFYEYRLMYNSGNNRWQLYINGAYKAQVQTNWSSSSLVRAGSELAPPYNGLVKMGPSHFQSLRYRRVDLTEVSFYYYDSKHCDVSPPLNPYNLIFPVSAPDWIYTWGPAAGGYCGSGAPW